MKKFFVALFMKLICLSPFYCFAQTVDSNIIGTWKGSSICQQKNSPCKDEQAIYHISKGDSTDVYIFQMNKMVNGVEEEMGATAFVYNNMNKTLLGKTADRQNRTAIWLFKLDGNKMHGTLIIDNKVLYRIIDIQKEK